MGRNVADYSVVRDSSIAIDVNGSDDIRMSVTPRNGTILNLNSILTFVIRETNNLRLRVDINNQVVFEENLVDSNLERTMQEIFPANVLISGTNEVTFTAIRGRGIFSDIVLIYRRKS
ncbi:MAG: hypothetical protein AAGL34_04115 [Bacteroidota bacterium]